MSSRYNMCYIYVNDYLSITTPSTSIYVVGRRTRLSNLFNYNHSLIMVYGRKFYIIRYPMFVCKVIYKKSIYYIALAKHKSKHTVKLLWLCSSKYFQVIYRTRPCLLTQISNNFFFLSLFFPYFCFTFI